MGLSGKLKRKDIDQVNDDFSDFSLSSPATKIRRLDAELPPIIEEDEPFPENHEKAIVVFNPLVNRHNLLSSSPSHSSLSLTLNSDLIDGFKNQFVRGAGQMKSAESEDEAESEQRNKSLAVIPWVPCQIPSVGSRDVEEEIVDTESLREGDEMDVEEEEEEVKREQEQEFGYGYGGLNLKPSETLLHHWPPPPQQPQQQQQHCMIPQPPQSPFTAPVTWSWSQ